MKTKQERSEIFKPFQTNIKRKTELLTLHTVSYYENAFGLVDYWCNKTFAGLLLIPFSRHQMLHLDGCLRIVDYIKSKECYLEKT